VCDLEAIGSRSTFSMITFGLFFDGFLPSFFSENKNQTHRRQSQSSKSSGHRVRGRGLSAELDALSSAAVAGAGRRVSAKGRAATERGKRG
jgi:hypothetical protein